MRPEAPCFERRSGQALATRAPLCAAALAAARPSEQKYMIGEELLPAVARHRADLAGKLTGMMLELNNRDLLDILGSEPLLMSAIE
eukprot:1909474-Lingulodinium_polyedra.AAC.1